MLPLVGSTISMPGLRLPSFSAAHIILAPMRHFTELAGLRDSIFAKILPSDMRWIFTSGVLPMERLLSLYTAMSGLLGVRNTGYMLYA